MSLRQLCNTHNAQMHRPQYCEILASALKTASSSYTSNVLAFPLQQTIDPEKINMWCSCISRRSIQHKMLISSSYAAYH